MNDLRAETFVSVCSVVEENERLKGELAESERHRKILTVQNAELAKKLGKLKNAARPVCEWYELSRSHFPKDFNPTNVILEVESHKKSVTVYGRQFDALCREVGE